MIARDVMTRSLVTVRPEMPVASLASLLSERGISGVPVTDEKGCLLGIVTEGDLLRRIAAPRDEKPGLLAGLFGDAGTLAAQFSRAHGRTVADVMTREVETVTPGAPLPAIATLMEQRGIRRVPVTEEGMLLGVVSRADLLRALLAESPEATQADDAEIRRELARRLREQPWADRHFLHASVREGAVTLSGFARNPEVARALRVLAEGVPGVRHVSVDLAPPPPFMLRGTP
ncbi:CBS domain-containing protein [Sabulicella glaciei]|uniref:CBS domain-containing protein n=1 Tax=Sabulicella glaciei TaxID=2984948 RepID=A0ABT3NYN1_9PROT|nr:CBS domain-containing protein [Roseococcus sp. MDT2-1-1]MCW8087277.1 CBS domain-containing protein [Roseococcus sp. MDT2-1-1]